MTNGNFNANFAPKISMLSWIFKYKPLGLHPPAVNYCADHIGSWQTLSTNDYAGELHEAFTSGNVAPCLARWKPIFSYNSRMPEARRVLTRNFKSMVDTCTNGMTQAEGAAFISNVIERARLNAEEIECLEKGYED